MTPEKFQEATGLDFHRGTFGDTPDGTRVISMDEGNQLFDVLEHKILEIDILREELEGKSHKVCRMLNGVCVLCGCDE